MGGLRRIAGPPLEIAGGAAGAGGARGRVADHGRDRAHEVPRQGRERGRQARRPVARAARPRARVPASRCRWSGCGASGRSRRPSCTRSACARSPMPRRSARPGSSRSSAGPRAAISTRSPPGSTRGRSTPPAVAVPSARSRRSAGASPQRGRARRDTRGHARPARPPPARRPPHGPHRGAAAAVRRLLARHPFPFAHRSHRAHRHVAGGRPGPAPRRAADDPRARHHAARVSLAGLDDDRCCPARAPVRRAQRSRHRRRARRGAAAIRHPVGRQSHPVAPPTGARKSPDWTIRRRKKMGTTPG